MSVRSSPSTENKGPVPFLGIPPSETWQILGPAFPLGDCPLLPAPTIPRSLGWWPPSTTLAFVPPGPQLDSGSKCRRLDCQVAAGEGAPRSGPTPGSPRTLRDARRRRRPRKATGCWGSGLCAGGARRPEKQRECRYFSSYPAASRKPWPRSCPAALASAASRPPGALRPVDPPVWAARPPPRIPGRAAAACRPVPTAMPRPARPDRDSWVPKGLSRQSCGPSAPRAASPPRAGPSAHAPARYLPSRSRSSSTWPLSPGGRPSARPLGSAPRTLLATRPRPGEEGRGGDYHILAYQRASRGVSSQWSLWKGGDWAEHAQVLLRDWTGGQGNGWEGGGVGRHRASPLPELLVEASARFPPRGRRGAEFGSSQKDSDSADIYRAFTTCLTLFCRIWFSG